MYEYILLNFKSKYVHIEVVVFQLLRPQAVKLILTKYTGHAYSYSTVRELE